MSRSTMGCTQTHARGVFTQPILIVIVILLVLVGFGASRLVGAQTPATAAPTSSSTTTRPLTVTDSTLPVPGMVNAKIDCAELAAQAFSKIPDAVTKITSATVVAASANSSQTCKIAGITAPNAMFVIQLPVKQWNGDYFQGGCGGLCGSLQEPAECATALGRGATIGYSDLGHESPKFTGKGDVNDGSNYVPVQSTTTSQDNFRWLGQDLFTPTS